MPAVPREEDDARIDEILAIIGNPAAQPVFVHCEHGVDRTGLIIALYEVKYLGMSAHDAYKDWRASGHKGIGTLFTGPLTSTIGESWAYVIPMPVPDGTSAVGHGTNHGAAAVGESCGDTLVERGRGWCCLLFRIDSKMLPTIPRSAHSKKLRRFGVVENTAALDNCGTNKRKESRVLGPETKNGGKLGLRGLRRIPDKGTVVRRGRDKRLSAERPS